jgi:hypothetical protein
VFRCTTFVLHWNAFSRVDASGDVTKMQRPVRNEAAAPTNIAPKLHAKNKRRAQSSDSESAPNPKHSPSSRHPRAGVTVHRELDARVHASLCLSATLDRNSTIDPRGLLVLDFERRSFSPRRAANEGLTTSNQRLGSLLERGEVLRRDESPAARRPLAKASPTEGLSIFKGISIRDRDCRNPSLHQRQPGDTSSDDSNETPAARNRRRTTRRRLQATTVVDVSRAETEERAVSLGLFQALMTGVPPPQSRSWNGGRESRRRDDAPRREEEDSGSPAAVPPRFVEEAFNGELYGVRLRQQADIDRAIRGASPSGTTHHRDPMSSEQRPHTRQSSNDRPSPPGPRQPSRSYLEAMERAMVPDVLEYGAPLARPRFASSAADSPDDHAGSRGTKEKKRSKRLSAAATVRNPSDLSARVTPMFQSRYDEDEDMFGAPLQASLAASRAWRAAEEERGTREVAARFVPGKTLFRAMVE